jgi:hypothetical protein
VDFRRSINSLYWYIFFLIRSLKAQGIANDLTNQKFIYDIKPFFTLSHPSDSYSPNSAPDTIFEKYLIKLERNVAKDFRIKVQSLEFYQEKYHNRKLSIIPVGEEFDIIYGDVSVALIYVELEIYIYFSDEIGNIYSQYLHGLIHCLKLDPPVSCKSKFS